MIWKIAQKEYLQHTMILGQSLRVDIWDIGLLALINLCLFAAAFVSFLRYDVH
jgi:hypothetical protein